MNFPVVSPDIYRYYYLLKNQKYFNLTGIFVIKYEILVDLSPR